MSGKQTGLTINEVEGSIQAESHVASMQARLRQSVFDSFTEDDVRSIVKKQVDKAKAGDDRAAQFVMKYLMGCGSPTKIQQTNIMVTDVETAARLTKR